MVDNSRRFVDKLLERKFGFFTGVPCSLLGDVLALMERDTKLGYVSATREDSALGFAAGAYMAGKLPVVFMQNSGLGVSLNALGSLHISYEIPALLVVSWRGKGGKDAPEHLLMGEINQGLFDLMTIPYRVLDPERMEAVIDEATDLMLSTKKPVALLVPKGVLGGAHHN